MRRRSKIGISGFRAGRTGLATIAVGAMLLGGCSSKTSEPTAPADNAEASALANEIEGMETDIRMKALEQRITDLETKLAEVQAKQEIADAVAEIGPVPKEPAPSPPKPVNNMATGK